MKRRSSTILLLCRDGVRRSGPTTGSSSGATSSNNPDCPTPAKWGYETGFIRNNERQFYTRGPEGKRAGGERHADHRGPEGTLARSSPPSLPRRPRGRGRRERRGRGLHLGQPDDAGQGRLDLRTHRGPRQAPVGRGTWPAIWMLGTNIDEVGWPACGEIDIMEFVGFDPGVIHANSPHQDIQSLDEHRQGRQDLRSPTPRRRFMSTAWSGTPKKMDFSVDGKNYFTYQQRGERRGGLALSTRSST